jgi:hypothetical protein
LKTAIFSLLFFFLTACAFSVYAQRPGKTMISGKILSTEKEVVDFATVYLKGTGYGGITNQEGIYHVSAPAGDYTLVVSAVGYKTVEKPVTLVRGQRVRQNVTITPETQQLDEVTVVSTGVSRVKRSAFNAVAVDTKELQNTTRNLSDALTKAPGMKLRESGGVGSDMQLMLDGFSGKHVKVFIDGVPQEGVGSSFALNNIPVNFADRIEVYKGVVPVGFGTGLSISLRTRNAAAGFWMRPTRTVRSIRISPTYTSGRPSRMVLHTKSTRFRTIRTMTTASTLRWRTLKRAG